MFFSGDKRITEVLDKIRGLGYYQTDSSNLVFPESSEVYRRPEFQECNYSDELLELRDLLLSFGGTGVILLDGLDPDTPKILHRGVLLDGSQHYMMVGQPCQCHSNSAWLWDDNRDRLLLCTGYALSNDGSWRLHSWCVDLEEPKLIVETTEPRVAYFGFGMTLDEAELFVYENL